MFGAPDNFTVMPLEIGGRFAFATLADRLAIAGTVVFGASLLTPLPVQDVSLVSVHGGAGIGVIWDSRLDGLTLGAEVLVRTTFSPLIPNLTFYPRFRYVF